MKTYYEVLYTDGLGNPRRWGLYLTDEAAVAGIARLYAHGITDGRVRLVTR